MLGLAQFPLRIGYDLAGTVVGIGSAVKSFKPGDGVYSRVGEQHRGTIAEYALSDESLLSLKPASLSFTEAAAIPLAGVTALQALDLAQKLSTDGTLKGKTVFVPAGLSGTGSFAVQLAKKVFGAGQVITTLSTGKLARFDELVGTGVVDKVVDYTKEDVTQKIGKGNVDVLFDTVGYTFSSLSLVKRGGVIVSITTIPSGEQMKASYPSIGSLLRYFLNAVDWVYKRWITWHGIKYSFVFMHPDGGDLKRLTKAVDEGLLKPVVGRTAKFEDIEQVREGCQQVLDGKGGVGKFVIEME